ncbi:hypothetical protein MHLP_00375 [Candidatus Mycoplasma haematolamae str. Purdue]|uniref:Uncharacterized protein n=1 Tax=Mycoplasma haematolamae (strain Purdue) TaxID=1212765 RepID=I7B8U1_MYCHA|nr:hypothetical protein [Candidatus Mycoplasma haematolamae]AFO51655.1 hypothetical protein MHLP_00375 [Candidatus Mycoplasma haematolamae str. Purdue]
MESQGYLTEGVWWEEAGWGSVIVGVTNENNKSWSQASGLNKVLVKHPGLKDFAQKKIDEYEKRKCKYTSDPGKNQYSMGCELNA